MSKKATSKAADKKATSKPLKKATKKITITKKTATKKADAKLVAKSKKTVTPVAEAPASAAAMDALSLGAAMASAGGAAAKNDSSSFKNFRHLSDIENFFRFIFENELRYDALALIDQYLQEKRTRKALKLAKAKSH